MPDLRISELPAISIIASDDLFAIVDTDLSITKKVDYATLTAAIYAGLPATYTDEEAQDAVGAILSSEFTYDDGIPRIEINEISATKITGDKPSTFISDFDEAAQDAAAAMIQNGTGITWSYNDGANTLTPTVTITQYTDEQAQDAIGAMVDSSLVYNDGTPRLSRAALTGDVTASEGNNATTIANDAVTFAKFQNISTDRLLGRDTAGSGDVEEISLGTGLAWSGSASIVSTITQYTDEAAQDAVGTILVDSSTIDFTYADGTPSITAIVINSSITFAKMQDITTDTLLGRDTAGTGAVEQITLGTGLAFSGTGSIVCSITQYTDERAQDAVGAMVDTTLVYVDATPLLTRAALTGDVTAAQGSNATTIANDAVTFAKFQNITTDRLLGRDTAGTGDVEEISLGTGLAWSGSQSINVTITQYTDEMVDDRVAALIQNGTGITWSYNDGANTLTPTVTITQYTDEMAQDAVGGILTDSTTIDFDYNDGIPFITGSVKDDSITFAKIQNITTDRLLGRDTAGTGDTEEISLGTGLAWSGSGAINVTITQYTDELAQDAIGGILSAEFTYDDATPTISIASVASTKITGLMALSQGGTNKNMTAVAGGIVWTDSDSMEVIAAGTTGRALVSGGSGAPTWFAPTAGSVIFAGTSGILEQDNANFFFDNPNNRLLLLTATTGEATIKIGSANPPSIGLDWHFYATSATFSRMGLNSVTGNAAYELLGNGTRKWALGIEPSPDAFEIFDIVADKSMLTILPSSGFVGIGNDFTNPTVRLDVNSGLAETEPIFRIGNSGVGTTSKFFTSSATPEGAITGSPGDKCFLNTGKEYLKVSGSATNTGWKENITDQSFDPAYTVYWYSDFTSLTNNPEDTFVSFQNSGTGSAVQSVASTGNHTGIVSCGTGTTTTGRSCLVSALDAAEPANGILTYETLIRIPNVSDGTETYTTRFGFIDAVTGESTDGAFFRYTHSVNSGKFEIVTRKAGAETAADSGTTVAANTWYKLKVVINAAANSVAFTINGTATSNSPIATNVPNTSSNLFGFGNMILKSAGSTSRSIQVDYMRFIHNLTTSR